MNYEKLLPGTISREDGTCAWATPIYLYMNTSAREGEQFFISLLDHRRVLAGGEKSKKCEVENWLFVGETNATFLLEPRDSTNDIEVKLDALAHKRAALIKTYETQLMRINHEYVLLVDEKRKLG